MDGSRYHKTTIGDHPLNPETVMLGYGYDPALSEGSVKQPVFLTSTFVFRTAVEGRDYFNYLAGRRPVPLDRHAGLIYSRFNHPNLEIVEDRLAIHESAEAGLAFSSGMAAIATSVGFTDGLDEAGIRNAAERAMAETRVAMIFIETPSNPMNTLVDISLIWRISEEIALEQGSRPIVCCDNTLLGPVFQSPLEHGADLSFYSLTKYVGGHSDLIGGAVTGSANDLRSIRVVAGLCSALASS